MKLLLDENVPEKLKNDLFEHEVWTAREKGWTNITNGTLLRLLISEGFDALITLDRNLGYQQNFRRHPIAVLVLVQTRFYPNLVPLIPDLKKLLKRRLKPGCHIIEKS